MYVHIDSRDKNRYTKITLWQQEKLPNAKLRVFTHWYFYILVKIPST